MVLLVRHELPLAKRDRSRLFPHLVVDVATSRGGGIYRDDEEALEVLNLVAQALEMTIQVNLIERQRRESMAYNGVPRPTYQKVTPRRKLDEIATNAKEITRQPLAPGSDTRKSVELKIVEINVIE